LYSGEYRRSGKRSQSRVFPVCHGVSNPLVLPLRSPEITGIERASPNVSNKQRTVLVAGAHGVIGRNAALHFARQPGVTVIGLSRRTNVELEGVQQVSVDLLDPQSLRSKADLLRDVTHIVFGAYIEKPTAAERSETNVAILKNLLDAVESASPALEHLTFYQGGKAYGADLGPFKTPAREDDPRLMPPNFYYDQEDLVRALQKGKKWHFTALRPEAVMGYAVGNPMNLLMVVAVYAAISKELGLPLRFPGTEKAYGALYQVTSADVLARATDWAGSTPAAANEIFNITNGDYFRWKFMWPRIAKAFRMEVVEPVPIPLATYMADKGPLWNEMVRKYGLTATPYEKLVSWAFGDFILNSEFDNISSTIKARRAGFPDCIDTEDMFTEFFEGLRQSKIIPPLS
jgi:nucleoside-diphosphate-sugar epimerase